MNKYSTEHLRNVALAGHGGSGKTSLTEALLFRSGAISRLGRVEEGTTVSDYDPEEVRRRISISTSLAPAEWQGYKLNLVDTPGYFDFAGEVIGALRAVEACLVVACAASGVEVGTEQVAAYAAEAKLPRLFFINKMDRENANFAKVVEAIQGLFGRQAIPVQLPIGASESFRGLVDVVAGKAYEYDAKGQAREVPIPADLQSEMDRYREELSEAVAMADDALAEKYLEGETLTHEEIVRGLSAGVAEGKIFPVLCGSALKNIGMDLLLNTLVAWVPSPAHRRAVVASATDGREVPLRADAAGPLVAQVFKTVSDPYVGKLTLFRVFSGTFKSDSRVMNASRGKEERVGQLYLVRGKEQIPVSEVGAGDLGAVAKLQETGTGDTLCQPDQLLKLPAIEFPKPTLSLAVEPKKKGDEDKIFSGLARLTEEDPTFTVAKNSDTGQTLVSGLGEIHLEVMASRLSKKFGVEVELSDPKIPYRETIRGTTKVEGKHKKQTGGRGQYGHVWLELEPLPPGGGFEFVDKIFGGAVPRQYIPAVEKGVRETMAEGVLAGYPVVDVRVTLYDGSYHPVDSSELAFKIAAAMAFKKGFLEARPILLEPIQAVEIRVPDRFMGDIMGDLNKKRGRVLGMEGHGGEQVIKAQVPLAEMARYAIDLRSMTQGRGRFTMQFDHYEEVPAQLAEQIIAAAKAERAG
ncbi:MAG: elongation factor G [Firmicutes bacterium]|nr:elongation factor G [Bacillota bacterium]